MFNFLILAARETEKAVSSSGKGLSLPVAIVVFLTLIGLGITLSPPRRTTDFKKQKDE
jgi:hypothetical protein